MIMDNKLDWLWLQYVLGCGKKIKPLLGVFSSARSVYEAGPDAFRGADAAVTLPQTALTRMKNKSPRDFADIAAFCARCGIHILTPEDPRYPRRLLSIEDFPAVLFLRGDPDCLNSDSAFAVIGSRTPCLYGEQAATDITADLAASGSLIVSGGALGIDSIAHRAALEAGQKTVLVMGCGHGSSYLQENADLRKEVAGCGALVTEYLPKTPVTAGGFPQRNRIISGLSDALVIIEAADPSGTFSTARHAKAQNRNIYVLPGDIKSGNFAGSNRLIREGAKAIFSADDILADCFGGKKAASAGTGKTGEAFPGIDSKSEKGKKRRKTAKSSEKEENQPEEKPSAKNREKNMPEGISKNAQIVYNIMSEGVVHLDEITRSSGLQVRFVLAALTELELFGVAEADGPNRYVLV